MPFVVVGFARLQEKLCTLLWCRIFFQIFTETLKIINNLDSKAEGSAERKEQEWKREAKRVVDVIISQAEEIWSY